MNKNEQLFFIVWRNIVLYRNIFQHIKLLNENWVVEFDNIRQLINCKTKTYIDTLIYNGEEILSIKHFDFKNGDIGVPDNYIVRKLISTKSIPHSVPYGIVIIEYPGLPILPKHYINQLQQQQINNEQQNSINKLPNSITSIVNCTIATNKPFPKLPNNLTNLSFKYRFNLKLEPGFLHGNIRNINFGSQFLNGGSKLAQGDIPYGVEILDIRDYTKQLDVGVLPETIKELAIGHPNFNNELDCFNDTVTIPPPVELNLPNSIVKLKLNSIFDSRLHIGLQSISTTITELDLNSSDVIIDSNSLPNSLIKLTMGIQRFGLQLNILPQSLKTFIFYPLSKNIIIKSGSLPMGLTSLIYKETNAHDYGWNQNLTRDILPPSLTLLDIGNNKSYNQLITKEMLPLTITTLVLPFYYNESLDHLSSSLTDLSLGSYDDKPITPNSLPNLKKLTLLSNFRNSLEIISISSILECLIFTETSTFNKDLSKVKLPNTLSTIQFGKSYTHKFINLPKNLKLLIIPKKRFTQQLLGNGYKIECYN